MSKKSQQRVPVTEHALVQRINRRLAEKDEMLRKSKPSHNGERHVYDRNVGKFYIVDVRRNFLARAGVDLEALGRELGALKPYEALEGGV